MNRLTLAAIAVLLIVGCGDTGPTQAQKDAVAAQTAKAAAAKAAAKAHRASCCPAIFLRVGRPGSHQLRRIMRR
jgi:hypothetical protein